MARRITRKQLLKGDEIAEAASDAGQWLEENWRTVAVGAAAVIVIAAVAWGVVSVLQQQRAAREADLAAAQRSFDRAMARPVPSDDDLAAALSGYEALIEQAPDSVPGLVARYYRAVVLRELGRRDDAIVDLEWLTQRSEVPATLMAAAETLRAHLYAAAGRHDEAMTVLREAAERDDAALPAHEALLLLGQMQRDRGLEEQARSSWQAILDSHPESTSAAEARRRLGT